MECVAFEYVLDFELERPYSAKSLEMQYSLQMKANLIAALSMVTTTKRLWSSSRYDFCTQVKINEKIQSAFLLALKLLHVHFFILRNVPFVTSDAYSFERPT